MRASLSRTILFLAAALLAGGPAHAGRRKPPPSPPPLARVLSGGPIAPNGTLIVEDERVRTLEIDDLTPARLRLTIPF